MIGVAAHEAGHALQSVVHPWITRLRALSILAAKLGCGAAWIVMAAGFLFLGAEILLARGRNILCDRDRPSELASPRKGRQSPGRGRSRRRGGMGNRPRDSSGVRSLLMLHVGVKLPRRCQDWPVGSAACDAINEKVRHGPPVERTPDRYGDCAAAQDASASS